MATTDLMEVTSANNAFANEFYKLISKTPNLNIFFSPLSVHTVLSMVYQGAVKETAERLATILGVFNREEAANGYKEIINALNNIDNVTLYTANKIYVMENFPLKDEFQKSMTELFLSEIEAVNFENSKEAAENVNNWVERKTNSKIKDIVSPNDLDCSTRLLLINAIYFKGNWSKQFRKENTNTEPFYITKNDKIDCQMMHATKYYSYYEDKHLNSKILEMMYVNKNISMAVILPNELDGINDLENKLVGVDLSSITQKVCGTKVNLSFPKFKIETTMDLKPLLKEMGLEIIFDEKKANFSEISKSDEQLCVSKVIQKAFIEVNEEGAEAAAATVMQVQVECLSVVIEPDPIIFTVDHPFIILLQVQNKNYKNTLFYGKIVNPVH